MKTEIKFLALMIMLIIAGSLTLVYGQTDVGIKPGGGRGNMPPPPPFDGFRRGPGGPDIYERISLTAQQKDQIAAIRFNTREASSENDSKMRCADEQLRMMIESGGFSVEKAQPLVRAKADAFTQLELIRLAADAEIRKLLTTEQKAQLAQFEERRPPVPPVSGFAPRDR